MKGAVFLDRDGTVIFEKHYLKDPAEVELLPGAFEGLRALADAGLPLFLVTNQSGIGRGYFTVADMHRVHDRMLELLDSAGVKFVEIYYAPEVPGEPSRGRKPSPQFLWDARDKFGVDLAASAMVGDKLIDLECGWNAGVGSVILVRTGYGTEVERQGREVLKGAVIVDDLRGAAEAILRKV